MTSAWSDVHAIALGDDEDLAFVLHVLEDGLHRPGRTGAGHGFIGAIDERHVEARPIAVAAFALEGIGIAPAQAILLGLGSGQAGDPD